MKKLFVLTICGAMLGAAGGCRIGECWQYAWNSRFHPERNARLCGQQQPYTVVADSSCDPCSSGTIVTSPGCGCSSGTTVTSGPIVAH